MVVYFGADHGGFQLKEQLKQFVKDMGYEIDDLSSAAPDPADDYPLIAAKVGEKVSVDPQNARGIVLCKSGAGVDITANKFEGVRSVLGLNPDQVYDARHDDDVNVLAVASEFTNAEAAGPMVRMFLDTPFGGDERYKRRIDEISHIEKDHHG